MVEFDELTIVPMQDAAPELSPLAQVYQALVLATRDYVTKKWF